MATPTWVRSPWSLAKRLKVPAAHPSHTQCTKFSSSPSWRAAAGIRMSDSMLTNSPDDMMKPQDAIRQDLIEIARTRNIPLPLELQPEASGAPNRLPRNVQALYMAPMRRAPTHSIPVCDLQLRSYSVRNLEFMADFAMRAAYYLHLPARGPVPLPRITQRWAVPRGNFVHKKSQETWERVTVRRMIQIQDGHPEVVQIWLKFIRKHSWYGIGYKANVYDWEGVETAARMNSNDAAVLTALEHVDWDLIGRRKGLGSKEEVERLLEKRGFGGGATTGLNSALVR